MPTVSASADKRTIWGSIILSGWSMTVVRTLRVRVDRVQFPAPRQNDTTNSPGDCCGSEGGVNPALGETPDRLFNGNVPRKFFK